MYYTYIHSSLIFDFGAVICITMFVLLTIYENVEIKSTRLRTIRNVEKLCILFIASIVFALWWNNFALRIHGRGSQIGAKYSTCPEIGTVRVCLIFWTRLWLVVVNNLRSGIIEGGVQALLLSLVSSVRTK